MLEAFVLVEKIDCGCTVIPEIEEKRGVSVLGNFWNYCNGKYDLVSG